MIFLLSGDNNKVTIFDEKREIHSRRIINGQSTEKYEISSGNNPKVLMVIFKPTAISRLFSIPVYEFTNAEFSMDDIIGSRAECIHNQLINCRDVQAKMVIIESFLIFQIKHANQKNIQIDHAVNIINSCKGQVPVRNVQAELNIGLRDFQRKFKEYVGLSPKQYARIIRLNYIISKINQSAITPNWQDISYMGGYYDQMHFIKDFKSFTGVSPSSFFEEESLSLFNFFNHKPEEKVNGIEHVTE